MKNDISYRTFDINALSWDEKQKVADEIYGIYVNIFQGWSRNVIQKHLNQDNSHPLQSENLLEHGGQSHRLYLDQRETCPF